MEVLVIVVVLLVLAALLLQPGIHAGKSPQKIQCVNNLKQIGFAELTWADANNDKFPNDVSVTNGGTKEIFSRGSHFQNLAFLNFLAVAKELESPRNLFCPADTNSIAATSFSNDFGNRNVSYFFGLNADRNFPNAFMSGDDNFEIKGMPVNSGLQELSTNAAISWTTARHNKSGNVLFPDGSIQSLTSSSLRTCWQATGFVTNRLVIP